VKRADLTALVGQPVRIVWHDATAPSAGWQSASDLRDERLSRVVTVAHLVHVSQRTLHVAGDWNDQDDVAATGLIPIRWVESVEALTRPPS